MASTAPYLMPDGRSLKDYLRAEREKEARRALRVAGKDGPVQRGKDALTAMLLAHKANANVTEQELAEIKKIEAAGVRRRRRYINDKTLRDMAGPLSALDMEAQFKPAPFGNTRPSPLAQMQMAPETQALWESFRAIEPDKEARVLQKWADHQLEQRMAAAAARQPAHPAASEALARWARVGRNARAALKQANPASVLALELEVQAFYEQAQAEAQLVLPLEDAFGRLLVHGLAEYYSLLSASKAMDGRQSVVVYWRRAARGGRAGGGGGAGAESSAGAEAGSFGASGGSGAMGSCGAMAASSLPGASPGASPSPSPKHTRPRPTSTGRDTSAGAGASASAERGRGGAAGGGASSGRGGQGQGQRRGQQHHEITCTDVLLAMGEVGQLGLSPATLQRYVDTHIHGCSTPTPAAAAAPAAAALPAAPSSGGAMVDGDWMLV